MILLYLHDGVLFSLPFFGLFLFLFLFLFFYFFTVFCTILFFLSWANQVFLPCINIILCQKTKMAIWYADSTGKWKHDVRDGQVFRHVVCTHAYAFESSGAGLVVVWPLVITVVIIAALWSIFRDNGNIWNYFISEEWPGHGICFPRGKYCTITATQSCRWSEMVWESQAASR